MRTPSTSRSLSVSIGALLFSSLLLGPGCSHQAPAETTDGPGADLSGSGVPDLTGTQPPDLTGIKPPDLTGVQPPDLMGTQPDMAHGGGAIQTVFLILMENHGWKDVTSSKSATYINTMLLPMAAHAENYHGPNKGNLHPSEPNYIWLEAGDNLGVTTDNDPSSNHQSTTSHLVTMLESSHISWRSYQEDIADGTCPLTSVGNYAPKHNPMVFFDDVINFKGGMGDPMAPRCVANVKPLTQLATDLKNNTTARYNFITPNECHDMHSSCAPQNDEIKQGDDWLSQWVPQIMASDAYKNGGALFITWDEGEISLNCPLANCPIGMIVVSPSGKGGGYASTVAFDHSSTLKTVQEVLGVMPYLRHAGDAGVNDLRDLFKTFP